MGTDGLAKSAGAKCCDNSIEVRVVEGVEQLSPKLEICTLTHSEVLEEAQIPVVGARAADGSRACVPEMTEGGSSERRSIEPLLSSSGAVVDGRTSNRVRPSG